MGLNYSKLFHCNSVTLRIGKKGYRYLRSGNLQLDGSEVNPKNIYRNLLNYIVALIILYALLYIIVFDTISL